MKPVSSLSSRPRRARSFFLTTFVVVGGLFAASCLTPDFNFDDPPAGDGDIGQGGNGNMSTGGTAAADHCTNRTKDKDETDTDCGGQDCDPCGLGRTCEAASDCVNESCTAGKCQMPTCTDKEKNLDETDIDCGGEGCPPCADDDTCLKNNDCESLSCSGGKCQTATCTDRIQNGDESDLDCGGDCDPCEAGEGCVLDEDCIQPPAEDPSTTECQEGICTVVCGDARLADCNSEAADGCEVDTFTDIDHCGACDSFCNPPHTTAAACVGGECQIDFVNGGCVDPYLDCNGQHDDGCEINTNTSAIHCGDCNAACSDENGVPSCSGGVCSIECDGGFTDCDDDPRNTGCEVNTDINAQMCGASCTKCTVEGPNDSPNCVAGECGYTTCDPGKGDCDGDGDCGDTLTTTTNCGSCGNSCSVSNATTSCADQGGGNYGCAITACVDNASADYENCDSTYANGCETNVLVSSTHCGACNTSGGENCTALKNNAALHIASILCDTGSCTISSCSLGYADCDGDATNGCEVNTNTDDARCGGCLSTDTKAGSGENCNSKWTNATGDCVTGACSFVACVSSNWGNCENGLTDGCETDLRVDEDHCGACGDACVVDSYTSTNTCSAKQCTATCNSNGAHCDSDQWNGCENIATDADNCGSCGNVCGGDGTDVSSASCATKACTVMCTNSMCPDSTPEKACTLPLGTTSNCSYCGEVCSGETSICTATGCKDHLPINVVATANFTATAPSTSAAYTLSSTTKTTRGLILLLAATHNGGSNVTAKITWNGGSNEVAMNEAHIQTLTYANAGIFYLQEADLPAAGTALSVQTYHPLGWGGIVGTILEVTDLYQTGNPVTEGAGTENLTDCTISISRSAAVTYADSLIVAVTMAQGNDGTGAPSGLTEVFDEYSDFQTHGMTGYKNGATANSTVGWNSITGCWDTILATATFRPWKP